MADRAQLLAPNMGRVGGKQAMTVSTETRLPLPDLPQFGGDFRCAFVICDCSAASGGQRVAVDLALRELRQEQVGLPLALQALVQHLLVVAQVQLARQGRYRA